ncbi:MAG TPA: hypothetical protein DHT43_09175, partial [Deltaproteobacteria bacterium]|nr:hypothetical protein [Deltaproteobacteria bacterium]
MNFEKHGVQVLQPVINLGIGGVGLEKPMVKMAKELKIPSKKVKMAISAALDVQKNFYSALQARGT